MPSAISVAFQRRTVTGTAAKLRLRSPRGEPGRRQAGEVSAASLLAGGSFADADPPTGCGELAALLRDSVPTGLGQAARLFQELAAAVLLARRSSRLLAACAVSAVWVDACNSLLLCGVAPFAALVHEAKGTGDLPLMSTWLQIFLLFSLPLGAAVALLKLLTSRVLLALGFDAAMAAAAQAYALWSLPAFLLDAWYLLLKEFHAAASGCISAGVVVDAAFVFVRWGFLWLFVFQLDLDVKGAGIALLISHGLRIAAYLALMLFLGHHSHLRMAWRPSHLFSRGRWSTLGSMMCPAMLGGVVEKLHLLGCGVLAGRLGSTDATAWQLSINVLLLAFVAAFATGDVLGLRMASFVAEGKFASARFVSAVGLGAYAVGSLVLCVATFYLVPPFSRLASRDTVVQDKLVQSRYALALAMPVVGLCVMEAALLSAQGRQWIIALALPACCWGVGFSSSYWLGVASGNPKRLGAPGVVDGLVAGYALAAAALLVPYVRWLLTRRSRAAGVEPGSPGASMQRFPDALGSSGLSV